jgi:hypothetical protein
VNELPPWVEHDWWYEYPVLASTIVVITSVAATGACLYLMTHDDG